MDLDQQHTSLVREYLLAVRRRWWLILAAVVVAEVVALGVSFVRTPLYQSTATLIFQKQTDLSSAMSGYSYTSALETDRELKTSAGLIIGPAMKARASEVLQAEGQATQVHVDVTAEAVADTNALTVTTSSASAAVSATVANAYADAFVKYKLGVLDEQLNRAEEIIQKKLEYYDTPELRKDAGYYQLASRLQDIRVMLAMATGNYKSVQRAEPAAFPYTPKHVRDAILGLIVGLLGGIAAVFLAEQLDVRVHTQDDLSRGLQLPIVGRLPRPSREAAREPGLAVLHNPDGQTAEAFRILRGNLDYVAVDSKLKSMLVTSISQGEGKTTTACNLAVTLARTGKRVAIVDADLRRSAVHLQFGLTNRVGLTSVIAEHVSLKDALQLVSVDAKSSGTPVEGKAVVKPIAVLSSGPLPPNPNEIVASERMTTVIGELEQLVDVVIIDTPPFLAVGDAGALAAKVDGILVVMRLGTVTRAMLRDAAGFMLPLPCRKLGVVVTNLQLEGPSYRYGQQRGKKESDAAAAVGAASAAT